MILGITGKYCSGKNSAAGIFSSRGWYEIDVDRLGHEVLEEMKNEVVHVFGTDITGRDGKIDRKKLGTMVFRSRKSLKTLEDILHPEMIRRCREIIDSCGNRNIVINAAILHKMGLNKLCNAVLWIKSPFVQRFCRAVKRDSNSIGHIVKRMVTQRELDAKYWREDVDSYIIWNISSIENLEAEVIKLAAALGERE